LLLPQQDHVVLVIIWFGANDASLPHLNPRQYVSISDYQQNLKTFIQLAHETHPHAKIMLVTPPPVVHEQRLQYQIQRYGPQLATGQLERTLENAGLYAQAALQVASECSVPCLNLWKEMQESAPTPTTATLDNQSDADRTTDSTATPSWSRFFCDGLHFSKQGHDYVGRSIVEFIHASFPSLAVTADPLTGQWANVSSQCGSDLQQYHGPPFHEEIDPNNLQAAFDKSYPTNATESLE
jgi:lysophospholipase L1-like esterase